MLALDPTNAVDYMRQIGILGRDESATATELAWGVSNVVIRVDAPRRSLVLKQSRERLRTRADWYSNLDRVFREAEVMRALANRLPDGTVPDVIFEDRDNFLFGMSAVAADHVVWKQSLLARQTDAAIARSAARLLGQIHASTASDKQLQTLFDDFEVFIQLRVEPFYWRMRSIEPELAGHVDRVVDEMFRHRAALVHADFSPKNLLVHDRGVTLVDYETGHWGDPAFDLGFFLSHLVLKGICHDDIRDRYLQLTRLFWDQYRDELRTVPAACPSLGLDELTRRAIGHFALCLRARIDGTSPVDYLPQEPKRQWVRALSRSLLNGGATCWDSVLLQIDSES